MATGKKTKRIIEAEGIAHVSATFNNTMITITDAHGNTISWGSSGKAGFKGSKKSTPFAATVAGEQAGAKRSPSVFVEFTFACRAPALAASQRFRRSSLPDSRSSRSRT